MTTTKESRSRSLKSLRQKERAEAIEDLDEALTTAKQVAVEQEINRARAAEVSERLALPVADGSTSAGRVARALDDRRRWTRALDGYRQTDRTLARAAERASEEVDAARERLAKAQKALRLLEKDDS